MTTHLDTDWTRRAQRLADQLARNGDLHHREWHNAVAAVARHVLVPTVYQQDDTGQWRMVDVASPEGLDLVYSPTTLVTKLVDRGTHQESVSSSTKPDLMLRMLEILDPHEGDKVLEIGTGTGYNAALLAHRLGEDKVFSVDVDRDLVDGARQRLARLGLHPTLQTIDGIEGLPAHAPYDRIITTCSVNRIPWSWAQQLAPAGRVLVDLKLAINAGNLVLLHRHPHRLEGRFTDRWASFMAMRHHDGAEPSTPAPRSDDCRQRLTTTPPNPWWDNHVVWFLAQFHGLPNDVTVGMHLDPHTHKPTAGFVSAPDGSWASVELTCTDGQYTVTEAGPKPLWSAVEQAHQLYEQAGNPGWERFGLTVHANGAHHVWLDEPHSTIATL